MIYGSSNNNQIGGKGGGNLLYRERSDDQICGDAGNNDLEDIILEDIIKYTMGNSIANGGDGQTKQLRISSRVRDWLQMELLDLKLLSKSLDLSQTVKPHLNLNFALLNQRMVLNI